MAKKAKKKSGGVLRLGTPSRRAGAGAGRGGVVPGGMAPGLGGARLAIEAPPRRPFGIPGGREMDRRAGEGMTANLQRLLAQQEFGSVEEANAFVGRYMGPGAPRIPETEPQTPLEEAQSIVYRAFGEKGKKRADLAREALRVSADCADAYVLLAEETAKGAEEACELYRQGVEAGERALGPEMFADEAGSFWGILETRPYMRARQGLARCLCLLGRREEAITHFQELLRLNPGDNQGNRHFLISLLIEESRDEDARKLLAEYPGEASASWTYSRALLAFRKEGVRRAARRGLDLAVDANPHVPDYLLGRKGLPDENPALMAYGEEDEAIVYAADALPAWQKSEGALAWLDEETTS